MKRIYRHKVQHLSDIIKQKEDIIEILEKEKDGNKASNNIAEIARPNNT